MDRSETQNMISEGTDVYGSDGEKVGSVVAVQPSYVVVEKGFFFPTDYYIPSSAIASAGDDGVYLNVTKDAALNQGWDAEPTGDAVATDTYAAGATTVGTVETVDTGYGTGTVDAGYSADVQRTDAGVAAVDTTTTRVADTDTIRVPIHEEELVATKRQQELGEVRIEKDVVSEQRVVEVPVTEERVRVERHAVDRPVGADERAFEEGVIEVPVMGEAVDLQKRVRVSEEVEVGKEAVQRTEQVTGTVRREEVRVEETVDPATTTIRENDVRNR
jgi:uncharacterized protein (TIGR02271 family)